MFFMPIQKKEGFVVNIQTLDTKKYFLHDEAALFDRFMNKR